MVVVATDDWKNARIRVFRFDKQVVVATHLKCVERPFHLRSIQGPFEPFDEPHRAFQALLQHGSVGLFAVLTDSFGMQLDLNALIVLGPFHSPQRLHLHIFVAGDEAKVDIVRDETRLREFPGVDKVRAPAIHRNDELIH